MQPFYHGHPSDELGAVAEGALREPSAPVRRAHGGRSCKRPEAAGGRAPVFYVAYPALAGALYFLASAASFSRYFFAISSCSCFGTIA